MKLALLLVLHFLSLGFSFLSIWRAIHNGQRKSHLIVVSVNEIDSFPSLFEGDVVEYMIDSNGPFLGAIALSGSGSVTRINQLCIREDCLNEVSLSQTREVYLYEHMGKNSVIYPKNGNERVSILAQWQDALFTQRIVEDRISNPHGEHAESVWLIPAERFRTLLDQNSSHERNLIIDIDSNH